MAFDWDLDPGLSIQRQQGSTITRVNECMYNYNVFILFNNKVIKVIIMLKMLKTILYSVMSGSQLAELVL